MKAIAAVGILIVASAGIAANAPAGWKILTDKTKNCQIAVPPDWITSQFSPSMANSPDKKANIVMHGTDRGQTLEQAKAMMEHAFAPTKVMEDSKNRLWYAYKGLNASPDSREANWYVGIPSKGNVCGVQINFKDSSLESLMKQIAESLAASK